jgi:hypothetical protein
LRRAIDVEGDVLDFFHEDIPAHTKEEIMLLFREHLTITTEEVQDTDSEAVMYLLLADSTDLRTTQKITLHLKLVRPWGLYNGTAHANDWRISSWWSGWSIPGHTA